MRALDPYRITLADGKEYEFFFSWAVLRKLAGKRAAMKEESPLEAIDIMAGALYDACVSRGDMTAEQFQELLPPDGEWLTKHIAALQKHSGASCSPPPGASVSASPPAGAAGSASGLHAEQCSDSQSESSGG